jgi:hypothetical protein
LITLFILGRKRHMPVNGFGKWRTRELLVKAWKQKLVTVVVEAAAVGAAESTVRDGHG